MFGPGHDEGTAMSEAMDVGNIEISVQSEEAAAKLRDNFADLTLRVNMDLAGQRFNPKDPISVEMAVAHAERSVDYNLLAFLDDEELQSLVQEIKRRFRMGIEAQAHR